MPRKRRWGLWLIVLAGVVVCAGPGRAADRPEDRVHKEYYDNGRLRMFLQFRGGLIVRKKIYYRNGRLQTDAVYAGGLPRRMRAYYETGQMCRAWDTRQGITKYYDRGGRLRGITDQRSHPLTTDHPSPLICPGW